MADGWPKDVLDTELAFTARLFSGVIGPGGADPATRRLYRALPEEVRLVHARIVRLARTDLDLLDMRLAAGFLPFVPAGQRGGKA